VKRSETKQSLAVMIALHSVTYQSLFAPTYLGLFRLTVSGDCLAYFCFTFP